MAGWGGGGWGFAHPGSAAYQYGNAGRILAFKLDGGPTPKPPLLPPPPPIPEPPAQTASAETIARGATLFATSCRACHANEYGAPIKDLRRMDAATHAAFDAIVLDGTYRALGMPQWDDLLTAGDVAAIHAYLIELSSLAYQAQQAATGN
jgi:quinohemoprotein ethanol dehydrogenase